MAPRLWPGETIVCIASGPSLTAVDVDYVRGKARVIVINTSYLLAKWADVLYACDKRWWNWYRGAPDFPGLKFALQPEAAKWPGVRVLQNTGERGLETEPTGLRNGRNSGYQAINLAVHLGAARIVLLGYDMQPGPSGKQHWHDPHPIRTTDPYDRFRLRFAELAAPLRAAGISVVNCTRRSALTAFLRVPLQAAL